MQGKDIIIEQLNYKYISELEVVKLTSFAAQTLRNWRCEGKGIPYYKINRKVVYRLDDVISFMEAHRIKTDKNDY